MMIPILEKKKFRSSSMPTEIKKKLVNNSRKGRMILVA